MYIHVKTILMLVLKYILNFSFRIVNYIYYVCLFLGKDLMCLKTKL